MATRAPQQRIDIGNVIGNGFRTLARNFLAFTAFALLLVGLPNFLVQYLNWEQLNGGQVMLFTGYYWSTVAVSWISSYLLQGIVVAIAVRDLSGRRPDPGESTARALGRLFPMIGLSIVSGIGIALGFLLLVVPGIILMLMWIAAVPVLVEERRGIFESLGRSAELTAGSKGWIFLLLLLYWGIGMMVSAAAGFAIGFELAHDEGSGILLPVLATTIAQTLNALLIAGMLAALYVELRQFKEGAAPEQLAVIFE